MVFFFFLEVIRISTVSLIPDPQSIPVGDGNAPKHCLPTTVKHQKEEEEYQCSWY